MNLLQQFNARQMESLIAGKAESIPFFRAGDTLSVHVRIVEGERQRIQRFEGVCIARRNSGLQSSFLVRRVTGAVAVERRFLLCSPSVHKIEVLRRGRVRRAKLYFLRERSGKSARIKELKVHRPTAPASGQVVS
ncbi:MAG: 50S ribosomal protein L19 [Alphaproteobacteria bacterium 40-19]|nr:MAG: 50S ribosomal protein L19 [Alphaproteobacteria bacterium 40-19]